MTALLELREIEISYCERSPLLRKLAHVLPIEITDPPPAVSEASFTVNEGETVAIVGESGSGKTTIARAIAGLIVPRTGQIVFEGDDITVPVTRRSPDQLRHIQYVFQNPASSLNPRRRLTYNLGRPLDMFFELSSSEKRQRIDELLDRVHLDPGYVRRFPTQLSGGEAQRVAIAQALAARPKLILCDEIISALDVSVQDTILDLLRELQADQRIAYLFIAHDLAVVRWLAHRVIVLYQGRIMETGTCAEIFSPPHHPYTELLLASIPGRRAAHAVITDTEVPGFDSVRSRGCPFAPRCPHHIGPICDQEAPPQQHDSPTHTVRCHLSAGERSVRQAPIGVKP